ncbi:uncharacterized protein LOC132457555 [Gadus macrocephalus]|uniref:uncharacterized protein LOC132457555 n=1 Tax=Gadus macrocephalus TaxID=80720 RepID=UPI0028CB3FB9|nr:uncharacterized protein LOC132457555 [Gadus macrocephalus]
MLSFEQQKELLQMQLDNSNVLQQLQFERLRFTEENERARRSLEHKKLGLEAQRLDLIRQGKITSPGAAGHKLDIATSLHLLPRFNEKDVDTFFLLFERVADTQDWPGSHRALLLQSRLTGKAQRAFSALTVEEARDYDLVKASVLRAYELIPEAYRQRFRNMRRLSDQTNVEFARELRLQCQRWCVACKVESYEELIDLIVLEQFKNTLPERVATYVAEKQATSESVAAVLVDEYELTHKAHMRSSNVRKVDFSTNRSVNVGAQSHQASGVDRSSRSDADEGCRYCHATGHSKWTCPVLKVKSKERFFEVKPDMLAVSPSDSSVDSLQPTGVNSSYAPFVSSGFVSLKDGDDLVPVKILRDTGASESFIMESVLPFSPTSSSGRSLLVRGIDLTTFEVPLHRVKLFSELVEGELELGIRPALPVDDVHVILGNNYAGGAVWRSNPVSVVSSSPQLRAETADSEQFPDVFAACAVTRSATRAAADAVQLKSPDDNVLDKVENAYQEKGF